MPHGSVPVAGAVIERKFVRAWKSETATDGSGNVAPRAIERSSLLDLLLPHRVVIDQTVVIQHLGKTLKAWPLVERESDLNNGLDGKQIRIWRRLKSDPTRRGKVFGIRKFDLAKAHWMSLSRPNNAAATADGDYLPLDHSVAESYRRQEPIGCEGLYAASALASFAGKSGGVMLNNLSCFGCSAGCEGRYAGDLLVAARCIQTNIDWLSRLNIGRQCGFGQTGTTIAKTSNDLVHVEAHAMKRCYGPSGAEHSGATLGYGGGAVRDDSPCVKSWLNSTASGLAVGSATVLTGIGKALKWQTAKVSKRAMGELGVALTASTTARDTLAWLLSQAANLCKEIGVQIKGLISAILSFLGCTLVSLIEVTVALVRWALKLLVQSLRTVAMRALAPVS